MKAFTDSRPLGPLSSASFSAKTARAPTPAAVNLQRLVVLRTIALAGQALAVWAAVTWLQVALPLETVIAILAAATIVNFFTWLRLRLAWPVRDLELFVHLTFDAVALTGVLYFAGGPT